MITGILAHVDAGKTTLSEGILYLSGGIRKLGRVDHQDAFLDTDAQERARGITIFSKQAEVEWKENKIVLLDTPGHVDFSAEMERVLQVLDYAILVISGTEGVQSHTETLWKLFARYNLPVFLFVNKMDMPGAEKERILDNLHDRLSFDCVDFTASFEDICENAALGSEKLLDEYMANGTIEDASLAMEIKERHIFPVYFGSALKVEGIDALLDGVVRFKTEVQYPDEFGAKVFKIGRDENGKRLTYLKVTGGSIHIRDVIRYTQTGKNTDSDAIEEKIDQIRFYNGAKYRNAEDAKAGEVCAVMGLSQTMPGQGLGCEAASEQPMMAPVLTYRLQLPSGADPALVLKQIKQLEEEDPLLHIRWQEELREIQVQLMGEVQTEVLTQLIRERYGIEVGFDAGSIVYRETIAEPIEGMGHYEPLRHYAEVHLLLEPGEPGSGIVLDADCSEDELAKNWQRLILTHLEEKEYIGVLTGSPITDLKITVVAGRAHLKHTEGGDFRQATYRAVRHGLMRAKNVLLEPFYEFRLEVPMEMIGRAMTELERMSATFSSPEQKGEFMVLTGEAPVSQMQGYATEVTAYTKGRGQLFCTMAGYRPCHNTEEVIERIGYDAEADIRNSADSVFCSHGAGFLVPWQQAANYMHVSSGLVFEPGVVYHGRKMTEEEHWEQFAQESEAGSDRAKAEDTKSVSGKSTEKGGGAGSYGSFADDKELEAIFTRTYGEIKRRVPVGANSLGQERVRTSDIGSKVLLTIQEQKPEYLLVDGYNVIFAWDDLTDLAKDSLDSARVKLMDILCNYQGYIDCELIVVFDAYRVKGNPGSVEKYHNINVVYTKEAETADMYIEKVTHEIGRKYRVTVATSDALEQLIVIGQGAMRISSREFREEVERVTKQKLEEYLRKQPLGRNHILRDKLEGIKTDTLPEE